MTQREFLFTLISYFAIVSSFIQISTDSSLLFCMIFLYCFCLVADSHETITQSIVLNSLH